MFSFTNSDSWVFSPPLSLTQGTTYKVAFYYAGSGVTGYTRIKGQYGTSASKAGMIAGNVFTYTGFGPYARGTGTFTPTSTGTYYFGWQSYNYYEGNSCSAYLDNIEIYAAPTNTNSQTIPMNNTTLYSFGSTGVGIKFDLANNQSITLNVDEINSSPGTNGNLPSGVDKTVTKYWNISPTNGAVTTGYYSISIDITGIDGISDPKKIFLLKRNNSNSEWENLGYPALVDGNICTWSGLNSFSEFTLGGDINNPLPVQLNSFNAIKGKNEVILKWQTTSEINCFGFEIERFVTTANSNNNPEWKSIGFIKGNGSSNSTIDYTYTDNTPVAGVILYRLKQIDTDGSVSYSSEISIEIGAPEEYSISQNFPNPFNPETVIRYQLPEISQVKLELFNILGEKIKTLIDDEMEPGNYEFKLSLSDITLTSGIYFYRITAGNFTSVKKMVILK